MKEHEERYIVANTGRGWTVINRRTGYECSHDDSEAMCRSMACTMNGDMEKSNYWFEIYALQTLINEIEKERCTNQGK